MLKTTLVVLLLAVGMVVAGPVIRTNRSENETSSSTVPEKEGVMEASSAEPEVTTAAETSTSTTTEVSTTAAAAAVTTKPRKTITFDQRQEGKFNIRADLENFVIVVVPSSPSAGISLLDLLNRSGQKGALQNKKKSAHRKGVKHHGAQKKAHHTTTPEVVVLDESHARVDNEEFIEGRTPYRVDISARSNDVPTADMPSPIYRVMRPLNYEQPSSSNMIRFPSASSSSSGNYYDDGDGSTVVRQAKALAPGAERFDEIRTNTVYAILTNGDGMIAEADRDDDDDHEDNYLTYAQERTFLDLPPFHPASSFDSLDDGEDAQYPRSDVDMAKLQLQQQQQGDDYSTLKLLGAQEQCGPDRRRDSYGICQFVAP